MDPQIYYMPVPVRLEEKRLGADLYYRRKLEGHGHEYFSGFKHSQAGRGEMHINKFPSSYILGFALESEEYSRRFCGIIWQSLEIGLRGFRSQKCRDYGKEQGRGRRGVFPEIDGLSDFDYRGVICWVRPRRIRSFMN